MVQKILIGVLAVIVIGAVVKGIVGYKIRTAPPEKKAAWIVGKLESKLDLSKVQLVKVNEIKDEILAKRIEVKELRKGFHETMLAQVKADTFDKNKVNNLFTSKEAKIKELRTFMVDKLAEFHAILTPAQRLKAEKYILKYHKRFRRWHR